MEKNKATSSRTSASGLPRDYVAIAKAYASDAVEDRQGVRFGKWVRLAAQRFLKDLKRAGLDDPPFTFDAWNAHDACEFIEVLPHVEGSWATETITLHESQIFFIVQLFGFRNHQGGRRYTTALLTEARKNAKSTTAAGILLYCFCCEKEQGPQITSAATTGSQARIIWNIAKRMVDRTADLRERYTLEAFANSIARYEVGGSFKPINAKASTQDGLNPSHVALDEIHAHKTHDLLNVLRSAAGARKNPLFLYTTTEGYENPGPWSELRHFCHQVLEEVVTADHFLGLYYAVDEKDDDFDESKWVKANPLMDCNEFLLKEIRKEAIEAKAMPGRHAEFRIKRLNRRAAGASCWVDLGKWRACGGPVDLDFLKDFPCWGGLDLASTRDLCSFRLVWPIEEKFYTYGWRWVPAEAVSQRTERKTVPYAGWVEAGHLIQTDGNVTDYDVIEKKILEAKKTFNIQQIAYDKWNATSLVNKLTAAEVPLIEFIQGPKSYHPAMQAFEIAYIGGNIVHGGDPVLTWCMSNLVARTDANLNMAPDKKRSADKIDDSVTLIMAMGLTLVGDADAAAFDRFLKSPALVM